MKAFPIANMEGDEEFLGMDLRDYFAAKALPMAYKHYKTWFKEEKGDDYFTIGGSNEGEVNCEMIAEWSYNLADAMIKARNSEND